MCHNADGSLLPPLLGQKQRTKWGSCGLTAKGQAGGRPLGHQGNNKIAQKTRVMLLWDCKWSKAHSNPHQKKNSIFREVQSS